MFDALVQASMPYLAEVHGTTVDLVAGASTVSGVRVIALRREYEAVDEEGIVTTIQGRDFLVAAADLPAEPRAGWLVQQTIAGEVCVFEVLPIAGKPAAEWADTQRDYWLLRTKRVGS